MKHQLENKVLTIYLEGEINSTNAKTYEDEIMEIVNANNAEELVLDFQTLSYISSAGLRIVLKLKQQHKNFMIINCSYDVYDVLQMTGFANLLTVKKALQTIDVTGCKVIGEGFFSTVYRYDSDLIVKVFKRDSANLKDVERELNLAKQAFILGVPTAISYDIVLVDGKYGVRFEMLDCASLRDLYRDHPEKFDYLTEKYCELLKKINTTECFDPTLPNANLESLNNLESVKDYLAEKDYLKLKKMLENLEQRNTFVHGDCHFKNIMVQNDDFLLIDMDTLSVGNPIFELSAIYSTYIAFEQFDPGNNIRFLGIDKDICSKLYFKLLEQYVPNYNQDKLNKIAIIAYLHMMAWVKANNFGGEEALNFHRQKLLELLPQYDDLDIGV